MNRLYYEKLNESLLDIFADYMKCEYLSDLKNINDVKRNRLAIFVEELRPEYASLFEWKDALHYLTGLEAGETAEECRERLISGLRKRQL